MIVQLISFFVDYLMTNLGSFVDFLMANLGLFNSLRNRHSTPSCIDG